MSFSFFVFTVFNRIVFSLHVSPLTDSRPVLDTMQRWRMLNVRSASRSREDVMTTRPDILTFNGAAQAAACSSADAVDVPRASALND